MRFIQSGLLLLGLVATCPLAFSQQPYGTGGLFEPPGMATLRDIEERILPLALVDGVARNETLADYYWDANIPLRTRLDEAARAFGAGAFIHGKPQPFHALTLISGPAGIGKTFIEGSLYRDWIPDEQICELDIRKWFAELAEQGLAESKPDVHHGDRIINRLLSLTPSGREEFVRRLDEQSAAFLLIDSLDEVHADDALFVLNQLQRLALDGDREFIHVVVFGRPPAFRQFWKQQHAAGIPDGLRGFVLNPPNFRTTGDLLVSSWNFNCWKYALSRTDSVGQKQSMSLSDYQRWCACDFDTRGEFADVRCKEDHQLGPEVNDAIQQWSMKHRVVVAVLPNLAGNSMVREIVDQWVAMGREFDERDFMEAFFAKWLQRDTLSGDRPSPLKPQHLELYERMLETVAAKYVDQGRLDRNGYFEVLEEDQVELDHNGTTVVVPVRTLLDRSGLVTMAPLQPEATRYRFEPFWFHRLLLQRHNERQTGHKSLPRADLVGKSSTAG